MLLTGNGTGREPLLITFFPTSHPITACSQNTLIRSHYITFNIIIYNTRERWN